MQPTGVPATTGNMPPAAAPSPDEKNWAMYSHFGNVFFPGIAPLIIYMMKKDESKFVGFHAMQAMYLGFAGWLLSAVTCGIGYIAVMILGVIAGMKVNSGEYYEYPAVGKMARESVYGK